MLDSKVGHEGAGSQLELSDPTAGFHGDNPESKAAHDSVKALKKNRREILFALFENRDWTVDELEVRTGWSHQGLSPRVTELKKAGQIVPTAARRATRSGRFARVFRRTA
jgi:hypothetical protein